MIIIGYTSSGTPVRRRDGMISFGDYGSEYKLGHRNDLTIETRSKNETTDEEIIHLFDVIERREKDEKATQEWADDGRASVWLG